MLVAHIEQDGVWSVPGGMAAWAEGLGEAIRRRGGRIRLGCSVSRLQVRQQRLTGVILSSGEQLGADSVVFNGDVSALASLWPSQEGSLPQPPAPTPIHQRSLSAMTWAMHAQTRGLPLTRHNVFFDDHYHREFDDIFEHRRLPARATVYLCAQDQGDEPRQLEAPQRLLALVNAPADGDQREFTESEMAACEKHCLALLRRCGLEVTVSSPQQVLRRTPADFHRMFPGSGGALYGPATHGWTALFQRQSATTALPGLYLAGGSIHPGPGVPMAAMSGRLAAATLMAHRDSMRRLHPVRISGGTSTPSVTTVGMR
jgi:1-hydroxycarotenoid 3,4-desaturase